MANDSVTTQETPNNPMGVSDTVTQGSEAAVTPKDTSDDADWSDEFAKLIEDELDTFTKLIEDELDTQDEVVEEKLKAVSADPLQGQGEKVPDATSPSVKVEPTPPATQDTQPREQTPPAGVQSPSGGQADQTVQNLPPETTTQAEPAPDPATLNRQYEEFFNRSVDMLAEKVYVLSDEDKERLDTAPSEVLPRLAGQLHMQVLTAAVTQVANMFPGMLNMFQDRQRVSQETEEKFFNKYPDLKGHRETVQRMAAAYRAAYPQATYEQAAPEIAAMAMVNLRLPMTPSAPQAQPDTPVVPTSARGGAGAPAPKANPTEWEELVKDEE